VSAENPYRPPTAAVRDAPLAARSPAGAVLAGIAVATVGSILASSLILYLFVPTLTTQDATATQQGSSNPVTMWFIMNMIAEGTFSLLGGYVCARMVSRNERRPVTILALLIIGADLSLTATLGEWEWLDGALVAMTAVCVLTGGELGRRRNRAIERQANASIAA
jgi:hypothetical protein